MKNIPRKLSMTASALLISLFMSCGQVNSNDHQSFSREGYFLETDTTTTDFDLQAPSNIKFFVEVSGSMNGFFRANVPTYFKEDFWKIINYYFTISSPITILTNSGTQGAQYDMNSFRNKMNTGAFVSTASTKVPDMIKTIINRLDVEKGEVAVLVSDMVYDPVGSAAPSVLLSEYSTDISKIFADFGKSACLICATSNFYNAQRKVICQRSPYYYLILGNQENVAEVRNTISSLLEFKGRFVDNIESGFDYGKIKYSFGISNRCDPLEEGEPTFVNYQEAEEGDTCKIELNVQLENYRWLMTNPDCFRSSFKAKTVYGSDLKVGNIDIKVDNITGKNHILKREAVAKVDLLLYNMVTDSEVVEWTLDIPQTNYFLFSEFFNNATNPNDPSKSYSLLDFINGIFHGGIVSTDLKNNYILISKNN